MTPKQQAAMQQALSLCESVHGLRTDDEDGSTVWCQELIDALREALAEPVQEPVYWEVRCTAHPRWMRVDEQRFDEYVAYGWEGQRLYTTPPQRKPEPVQEPVAWRVKNATPPGGYVVFQQYPSACAELGKEIEPLYTAHGITGENT